MPSDTPIYRNGKRLMTSRRAYEGIYKDRGWRLRPPKESPSPDGDQKATEAETNQEG